MAVRRDRWADGKRLSPFVAGLDRLLRYRENAVHFSENAFSGRFVVTCGLSAPGPIIAAR